MTSLEDIARECIKYGHLRGNFECTEQRLCDQKKQIEDKKLLISAEIEEVKQVEKDNTTDEHIQQPIEEQHTTTDTYEDVESASPKTNNPTSEASKTPEEPDDNEDDYEQINEKYLELLEVITSQPMKDRKRLPKVRIVKSTKRLMKMVNRIVEEISRKDIDTTKINQMQYAGFFLITNKGNTCKTNNQ